MSETCLRRRLRDHLLSETNPCLRQELRLFRERIVFGSVYTELDQTRSLEQAVIRAWRPRCNRTAM